MKRQNRDRSENGWEKPVDDVPMVTIYADGSCLRNGTAEASAGCGAVIIERDRMELKLVAKHLGSVTNQQAEILACATAMGELKQPSIVEIVSDSRYVVDTMTGRNRMRSNKPFWTELVSNCYTHYVTWRWVKGHAGITFQEAADRLSRVVSTQQCSLSEEDLSDLAEYLSSEKNQLNIKGFERRLSEIAKFYDQLNRFEQLVMEAHSSMLNSRF